MSTAAVAALHEAETAFLRALGWTEKQESWAGRPVVRWVDPRNGDEMDKWAAVARAKTRHDFDALEPGG